MNKSKQYSNYSHKWYTPDNWRRWVIDNLGPGYHDPCPVNPTFDGLTTYWDGNVYCNHPGGRGQAQRWWQHFGDFSFKRKAIWCAFSLDQLRTLKPSPLELDGWLVLPRKRVGFIWGGPDQGNRKHGQICKSPSNTTAFWCNFKPTEPPEPSIVMKTGDIP